MIAFSVVVQHRHVHLSAQDQQTLFGNTELTPLERLRQRGQIVYRETVTIVGKRGELENVHVIGPSRENTQAEISSSDAFALGIDPPLRVSGDVVRTAPCELKGPVGNVRVPVGLIIPARHIHCNPEDAQQLGVNHMDVVDVSVQGRSDSIIESVTVRVHPTFEPEFHLTEDEAAEYWIHSGDKIVLQ
jgi:putative phosphotransacetylase